MRKWLSERWQGVVSLIDYHGVEFATYRRLRRGPWWHIRYHPWDRFGPIEYWARPRTLDEGEEVIAVTH